MEKRMIDVALRYDVDQYTVPKWQAYTAIKHHFEGKIGRSIYTILPGVVEATFGFSC